MAQIQRSDSWCDGDPVKSKVVAARVFSVPFIFLLPLGCMLAHFVGFREHQHQL
jgi:hypothetical protein